MPRPRFSSLTALLLACALLAAGLLGCASDSEERKEATKKGNYHYQLGSNYFSEQMVPQALRELLLAVEADPQNADALHLLGFIYMGRRDYNRAIDYFRQAIALRPDFYICLNNLGAALLAAERWDEAIVLFEDLIAKPMYNTPELAYNNLGWAQFKLNNLRQASDAFEMAVFLQPKLCLAYNNLGLVREAQGNTVGALRAFQDSIEGCPNYVEPHFHLAQLLFKRQDPNARLYFQRCYELASDSSWGDRCRSYLEIAH